MWSWYMNCNVMWCLTFTEANKRKNATKYCLPLVVFILYQAIPKLQWAKSYYFIRLLNPLDI